MAYEREKIKINFSTSTNTLCVTFDIELGMNLALSFVVSAIGRAGLGKEVGLLRPGPRGPKVLRHQMVQ